MDEEELKSLKFRIKHLFSNLGVWNPSDQLSQISEYYTYLADTLDYQRVKIDADPELIQRFESVYLWLQDRLVVYPDTIRRQISEIVEEASLCELFAILSTLSRRRLPNLRQRSLLLSVIEAIPFWRAPRFDRLEPLRASKMLGAKMALNRLSQVLEFAASIEVVDFDETFSDFKEHFDPNLIDKTKLLALANFLLVQAKSIPEEGVRSQLTTKLEDLEAEIRKPRVRWGAVIAGFFILFGFLADLKTMNPEIYDKPLHTVESILSTIHKDSLVSRKNQHLLNEGESLEPESGS